MDQTWPRRIDNTNNERNETAVVMDHHLLVPMNLDTTVILLRAFRHRISLFVRLKRTYMECLKNLYRNISYCVFLRVCVYVCYINRARVSVFVVYKRRDVFDVPIGKCIHILYNHLYIPTMLHICNTLQRQLMPTYYMYIHICRK